MPRQDSGVKESSKTLTFVDGYDNVVLPTCGSQEIRFLANVVVAVD